MNPSRAVGLAVLSAATTVAGAALTGTPAYADTTWPVPHRAQITVHGRGWGHGHGMSQYGAEGAAQQGLDHRQIIDFYYPGTTWATAAGKVSVLIAADTSKDVLVDARPGLTLTRLATHRATDLTAKRPQATRWRILPLSGHRSRVSYRTGHQGGWRTLTTFAGDAQFAALGRPVTLRLPHHQQAAYRGALRSVGHDTVNLVPLERYVMGVVPREMPAVWHAAAVQAQAVAARTYATFERATPLSPHYQICDSSMCQVYGGFSAEQPESDAAVTATRGEVLTYQGAPAFTQFSSSNGGWTAAGGAPYLPAQPDPYDGWVGNPNSTWTTTLTDRTIEKAWPKVGDLRSIRFSGRDGNGQWGGRIGAVTLTGTGATVQLTADEFRLALALRSTWIDLTVS